MRHINSGSHKDGKSLVYQCRIGECWQESSGLEVVRKDLCELGGGTI